MMWARRHGRRRTGGVPAALCGGACLLLAALAAAQQPDPDSAKGSGAEPKLEPRGRVSLRDYYLFDSQSEHTTHLLSGDLDVYLPRVRGTGLSFLFDGEFRKDLSYHPEPEEQEEKYSQEDPHSEKEGELLARSDRTLGRIRGGTLGDYIRNAWVEYAGIARIFAVQAGRMMLTDLGQTWVDGAVVRGERVGFLLGAFGGLAPDPFDCGFNTTHQTAGGFAGYTGRSLLLRLAFNHSMVEGETDRQFLFSSGHLGLLDQLFLSYSATLDLAGQKVVFPAGDWKGEQPQREDLRPQLTMAFVNLLWWATPRVSFTLSGDTFRNVPYRISRPAYWPSELDRDVLYVWDPELKKKVVRKELQPNDLPSWIQRLYLGDTTAFPAYYGLRFSPAVRFGERWYAFLSLDWRSRELDGEEARYVSVGVRGDDLWGSGIATRLEYTARNGFLSDANELFVSASRKLLGRVDLALFGTLIDGRSMASTFGRDLLLLLSEQKKDPRSAGDVSTARLEQRQRVWLLGASLDIDITQRLYVVLDYELTMESLMVEEDRHGDELVLHGLNGRLTWRL